MKLLRALGIATVCAVLFWLVSMGVILFVYGLKAGDLFAAVLGVGLVAYLGHEAFLFLQHMRKGG